MARCIVLKWSHSKKTSFSGCSGANERWAASAAGHRPRGVRAPWSTKKLICRGRRWASDLVVASLATTAKGKQRLNLIVSQSEIKDVKGFSHVRDICCPGEGHHAKLQRETIDYLRNRLVMMAGNLGHAWFYKTLPISRK